MNSQENTESAPIPSEKSETLIESSDDKDHKDRSALNENVKSKLLIENTKVENAENVSPPYKKAKIDSGSDVNTLTDKTEETSSIGTKQAR